MLKRLALLCIIPVALSIAVVWTKAAAQDQCLVADPTGTLLNVRSSPDGHIVGALSNGTLVTIFDRSTNGGSTWVYVGTFENRVPIGWVYRDYLDCNATAESQPQPYTVSGLRLGGRVNIESEAYKQYRCTPSEKFPGFTWCHKDETEKSKGHEVHSSYSILHTPDGTAVYVNHYVEPVFLGSNGFRSEIDRLSTKFGERPREFRMSPREGLPNAVVAVWGNIRLEQLDPANISLVRQAESHSGLLVSFLGDVERSARAGVPVYRLAGGAGFVWAVTFDREGQGVSRSLTIDASKIEPVVAVPQPQRTEPPPPPVLPPPHAAPNEEPAEMTSFGTAFFVAPNLLLTNNHVVAECKGPIQARYPDRPWYSAMIFGRDETNDLALLHTEMSNLSIASFRFQIRLGEAVAAYGFPYPGVLSPSGNFTLGNVASLSGIGDDTRFLQISTPTQPGNSGGPILDMSGNVVGVVESQLNALAVMQANQSVPQNVNFAIQVPIVVNFLSVKGATPKLDTSSVPQRMTPSDVADLAKKFTVQVYCKESSPKNVSNQP